MTPNGFSRPETGLAPDVVRQYLDGTSQRELDALRSALDVRLGALEAALTNPKDSEALETLVADLAHVATAEAEATATRVCLQARLDVEEQVSAARTDAEQRIQAERSGVAALRLSAQQAKVLFDDERRTTVQLRGELEQARAAIVSARAEALRLVQELQEAQMTLEAEHAAGELVCRTLEDTRTTLADARTALEAERAAGGLVCRTLEDARTALEAERAAGGLVRTTLEDTRSALEAERAAKAVVQRDLDDSRCTDLARQGDLENARRAAAAFEAELSEALRALEARRDELVAAHSLADARRDDLEAAAAQLDGLEAHHAATEKARAAFEQAWQQATARTADAVRDRDALARELQHLKETARAADAVARAELIGHQTGLANTEGAMKDAEDRAEAAGRALEAHRQMARAQHSEMREGFEQRIRDLEQQLADRALVAIVVPDADAPLADSAALAEQPEPAAPVVVSGPPWPDQPIRSASRHGFSTAVHVLIDGGAARLIDLSTSGAQVVSPTPLKPNRVVKLQLPSDEKPIACRGKIVWARLEPPSAAGPLRYRAGIYFTGADVPAVAGFLADYAPGR